jgi:hypothetical protein
MRLQFFAVAEETSGTRRSYGRCLGPFTGFVEVVELVEQHLTFVSFFRRSISHSSFLRRFLQPHINFILLLFLKPSFQSPPANKTERNHV